MTTHLTLAIVAVFASVALATGLIASRVLALRMPERRRFKEMFQRPPQPEMVAVSLLVDAPSAKVQRLGRWVPRWTARFGRVGPRLEALGYRGTSAVIVFSAIQLAFGVVAGLVTITAVGPGGWYLALASAALAYFIPNLLLLRRFRRRQKAIQNGLPDALDLCVICLEAGCTLDHAINKTCDELALAYPELASELRILRAETRAGKPKIEAFKNFAQRTQVDDVRALVGMLVQTDKFGTSIAQALRTHAEVSRGKRKQRAEERAAKASVKLVFPLVCFLFPAFYVITLGPAILQFTRVFSDSVMPAFK
jgi:tight adherence protein C